MYRRWISMLLSAMMLLGLSGPAFAEGKAGPPPVEDAVTEGLSEADIAIPGPVVECGDPAVDQETAPTVEEPGPVVECGAPATEPPETEDGDIAMASYEIGTKNALPSGGVTVDIAGPLEQITWLSFDAPGGGMYDNGYLYKPSMGLCRWIDPDQDGEGNYTKEADALPAQVCVYPGTEIVIQTKPEYDVTVSAGEIIWDTFFLDTVADGTCGVSERIVNIMAPESGSMTITVALSAKALPRQVPYTEYGIDFNSGFRCSLEQDTACYGMCVYERQDPDGTNYGKIYTGVTLCFELAPGWTIEVLKGGQVTRVGGFCYPTSYTDSVGVDIRVDDDAEEFVYAIVKQGEHFDPSKPRPTLPPLSEVGTDTAPEATDTPFQDVAAGSWYADDVERAYVLGVIQGTEDNVFHPNAAVTRGQTVTMLYRAKGSPDSGSGAFADIADAETASAASWAAAQGIVKGVGGGAFDPGSSLTREQFVTVLYRLAGSPDAGKDVLSQFKDGADTSAYAVSAMNWALNNGVLSGYGDGIIQPRGVATRAEVCALIMRFTGA